MISHLFTTKVEGPRTILILKKIAASKLDVVCKIRLREFKLREIGDFAVTGRTTCEYSLETARFQVELRPSLKPSITDVVSEFPLCL